MWQSTHALPDPGAWCVCARSPVSVASAGWHAVQVVLSSFSSCARELPACGSWQVVHDIWLEQPPSWKSRPSLELTGLPPGTASLRLRPSHVHGYANVSTVWQRAHARLIADARVSRPFGGTARSSGLRG